MRTRFDESAVTRLKTPNPRIADTRTARRRNPRVNAISGTAPTTEPNAYAVTNCPAPETDTDNPDPICTSSPAGMVSVVIAMKPAIASADNPASGSVRTESVSASAEVAVPSEFELTSSVFRDCLHPTGRNGPVLQ